MPHKEWINKKQKSGKKILKAHTWLEMFTFWIRRTLVIGEKEILDFYKLLFIALGQCVYTMKNIKFWQIKMHMHVFIFTHIYLKERVFNLTYFSFWYLTPEDEVTFISSKRLQHLETSFTDLTMCIYSWACRSLCLCNACCKDSRGHVNDAVVFKFGTYVGDIENGSFFSPKLKLVVKSRSDQLRWQRCKQGQFGPVKEVWLSRRQVNYAEK